LIDLVAESWWLYVSPNTATKSHKKVPVAK